ncbi:MAG: branched chain amino acid: 2-keto-4-methylthiobutyrate aminotransferase, partial [Ramlibacter sp.]|nr:branched chain amino acid: 2-keto-4-methylthiobutyrate aminotransferase [Ramlibacter sp.]
NPMGHAGWREVVDQMITAYAGYVGKPPAQTNQLVYLQVTRGVAMRDHVMPPDITPTAFAMVNRLYIYTQEERGKGVACVTADDFRWKKAHIKSTSLAGAVLSRQMSADEGANETIMFRDGFLSEAAASNVWVVKNGVVLGPPKDNLVLEGIRYGLLEELCRTAGIPFELRKVSRQELLEADEVVLSSATKEVLPCTVLDGRPVGNGKPGPIYQKLFAGYQLAKRSSP